MRRDPNFIIAGGVATGTSFLSHTIKDHPQIYLPRIMRPECGFFYKSWEYEKGKDYYLQRWFDEVNNQVAVGERSSLYLHGEFNRVAERIHSMYPAMKLIFCLRNPTERAWGNYRFTVMTGFETLPFQRALELEEERKRGATGWQKEILPNLYRQRGCYYDQLQPYFECFPKEQILCIKSETLSQDTAGELKRVLNFLGVDPDWQPPPQENFSSPNVKSALLQRVFKLCLGPKLDVITEDYRKNESRSWISRLVRLNLTESKQPMPAEDRKTLNRFYAPHNEKLARFLGWDLSDWN